MAGLLAGEGNVPLKTMSATPKMTLQQAVRDGREEVLRDWLTVLVGHKKKHIIDARDSFGFTAMHYASRFNRFKMMQLLVTNDADTEVRTDDGLTPLHYAARYTPLSQDISSNDDDASAPVTLRSNSRQIVQLLVNICRVQVNVQDIYGVSPLQLACGRGNRVAVEVLLSSPEINVDIQDKQLDTPLHAACLYGDPFIVEKLLEKNADCLLPNLEKDLPIHIACQEGHIDIVNLVMRMRFNQRSQMLSSCDHEFNYPLHLACESGNVEIVKVLFLNQADPNVRKIRDISPLHIAAKEGFTDIVDVLLQYEGAEINITNEDLHTPLHYAARYNRVEMIEFLLKKGADLECQDVNSYTALLTAVSYGQLKAMNKLLEQGASPDEVDREGKSIVFIAAENNRSEILKNLILGEHEELGNDLIGTTDGTQNTSLHIACKKGNLESVKILLKSSSVKVDARNEEDSTPLHLAAQQGHSHVVQELYLYSCKHNLDIIKDEDDEGNTALHLACLSKHYETAKTLLLLNADPDARNVRQWTSLDCAAVVGEEKIVELLIDAKAIIDPKDIANVTPLQLACKEGHLNVVNILLNNGANVSLCNSNGLNALDIAVENGNKLVAMAIIKSSQWQNALRNVTETPDGRFTTPMRRILHQMPDVAKVVFNRCSTTNEDVVSADSTDYRITFDYEFLEDFRDPPGLFLHQKFTKKVLIRSDGASEDNDTIYDDQIAAGQTKGYQTTWGPPVRYSRKDHCLQILANSKSIDLLKHPLPASLLNHKWQSYGQMLYFLNLIIYIIFVIFLTAFALSSLQPTTFTCISVLNGSWNSSDLTSCTINNDTDLVRLIFIPIGASFVILFAVLKLLFELIQFLKYKHLYFLDWVNYMEIILFVFSIVFAFIFFTDCFCPTTWQWELGAIAVFLSWIDLVVIIRKLPVTGIYVVMFMNILYIFLKLAFLAILLILAFGFSFFMVFHDPLNLIMSIRTPFHDPGRSLVKTMTMTTGEFEFDQIFRQAGERPNIADLQYPTSSYILWILFIILMPILLTNLLVGLAVDDIKGMQESAAINRLALRVELTLTVEEYLPLWLRKRLIIGSQVIEPNKKLKFFDYVRKIGSFRFDSIENIRSALNPPHTQIDEIQQQNQQLSHQVDELRRSMITLSDQNEKLLAIVTSLIDKQGIISVPTSPLPTRGSQQQLNVPSSTDRSRNVSVPPPNNT